MPKQESAILESVHLTHSRCNQIIIMIDACWLFLYFAIITSDILDALRILAQYIHFGMSLYTGFVQINN